MNYASKTYGVPADIGRRVTVYGKPGIITADLGNYIGVNLDADEPGRIRPYHPTDQVIYGELGTIRPVKTMQDEIGELAAALMRLGKMPSGIKVIAPRNIGRISSSMGGQAADWLHNSDIAHAALLGVAWPIIESTDNFAIGKSNIYNWFAEEASGEWESRNHATIAGAAIAALNKIADNEAAQ
jgi:hypothetical protein